MKRIAIALAVLAVFGLASSVARADHRSYGGGYGGGYGHGGGYGGGGRWNGGHGFRAPIYHGPSVHYDRQYHADYLHWTPGRGYHTHGHYDVVPHFVPGHLDTLHGNHVHANPWYHH